jgi:hypothetical protein
VALVALGHGQAVQLGAAMLGYAVQISVQILEQTCILEAPGFSASCTSLCRACKLVPACRRPHAERVCVLMCVCVCVCASAVI